MWGMFLVLLQDAFPFVTHDLAMSLDGEILYGLDDPARSGGAKAIRCPACSHGTSASSQ